MAPVTLLVLLGQVPACGILSCPRITQGRSQPQMLWGFLRNQHYHIPLLGSSRSPGLPEEEEWESRPKERGDEELWDDSS